MPTTISHRNDIKVMFMAVVAKPIAEHNFDGKIFLERVAREEEYKRATTTRAILG